MDRIAVMSESPVGSLGLRGLVGDPRAHHDVTPVRAAGLFSRSPRTPRRTTSVGGWEGFFLGLGYTRCRSDNGNATVTDLSI
jgi:hypothetical protein